MILVESVCVVGVFIMHDLSVLALDKRLSGWQQSHSLCACIISYININI